MFGAVAIASLVTAKPPRRNTGPKIITTSGATAAPVRFVLLTEDDAGDPRPAVAAAQKLTDSRVHGVVGHLHSGTAIPASMIYQDAGIVHLTTATNPKLTQQGFDHVFRVAYDAVNPLIAAVVKAGSPPPIAHTWPISPTTVSQAPSASTTAAASTTTPSACPLSTTANSSR